MERPQCSQRKGFTLYELVMTLGLIAVIVSLGLPSFAAIAARSRQRTEVDALFHNIYLARKESVARRRAVSLCPSLDGLSCTPGGDWSSGWMRFVNTDRDEPPVRDPDEAILHFHVVDPATRISANRTAFTLRSTDLRATNGTLVVCDRRGLAEPRAIVVSYTGRPRVALTDTRGRPYACAD